MPDQVESSKRNAAFRQIMGAIDNYEAGHFECAITLAGAAEGVLPQTDRPHLFQRLTVWFAQLRGATPADSPNAMINWLKHPSGPDTATISELEVMLTIQRAISKFSAVHGGVTPRMRIFMDITRIQQAGAQHVEPNSEVFYFRTPAQSQQ
jgi:hypothetical protein